MIDVLAMRAALVTGAVVAAADVTQATEPQSVIIAAVTAATLAVLAVLIPGIIAIIKELRVNRDIAEVVVAKTEGQNKQLDKIEILVDGRYGEVLQEMADLNLALATLSGLEADKVRAENSQKKADVQAVRVDAATKKENE